MEGSPVNPDRDPGHGDASVTRLGDRPALSGVDYPKPATAPKQGGRKGEWFLQLLRTTDHKTIGRLYMVTSLVFFAAAGVMAMLMRAELARPGMQFLGIEQYNQLFTMHGTIMLLL